MLAHTFCHISERARHAPRTSHHDTCTRWCACVLCVHRHQLFDFAPRDAPGGGGSSRSSCLGRARQRQLPYAVRHRVPCTPWCTDATGWCHFMALAAPQRLRGPKQRASCLLRTPPAPVSRVWTFLVCHTRLYREYLKSVTLQLTSACRQSLLAHGVGCDAS